MELKLSVSLGYLICAGDIWNHRLEKSKVNIRVLPKQNQIEFQGEVLPEGQEEGVDLANSEEMGVGVVASGGVTRDMEVDSFVCVCM